MNPTRAVFQPASVKAQKNTFSFCYKAPLPPPPPYSMLEGNTTISYEKHLVLHNIESGGWGEKQRRRQKW